MTADGVEGRTGMEAGVGSLTGDQIVIMETSPWKQNASDPKS